MCNSVCLEFNCADCGKKVKIDSADEIHHHCESQLAYETRKLYCKECND